jgi:hypothetical protein
VDRKEELVKLFAKGSRVKQSAYGSGTVTSSDERYTVIEFDNHGKRTFVTDMVTLGASDEPAPNRPEKKRRQSTKTAGAKAPTAKVPAAKARA